MPRPRKEAAPAPSLNPGQAAYVIERLISERRVSAGDVSRYVTEMQREISDLELRLNRLREAHGGSSSSSGGGSTASAASPARRGPGRPPGRPAGSGRGPGRPAGRRPGRPAANSAGAGAGAGSGAATGGDNNNNQQQAGGGAKRGGRKARSGAGAGGSRKGGGAALSSEQLASRQLQGRYLALVRQFPENRRAQFAKTAKERGREVAIREMQDSLKK